MKKVRSENIENVGDDLLFRCFSGEATERERMALGRWIAESPENRSRYRNASALYEQWLMSVPMDTVSGKSAASAARRKGVVRRLLVAVADVAAVALVCIGVSWGIERRDSRVLSETMTTVEVPAGNRMDITLEDGTRVRLNSGARLSYPVRFADDRREVSLSGEACFEVTHAPERPFTVRTFASEVQVLGTEFDVNAREEDGLFSVALLHGSVKLRNSLKPGQEIVMSPGETVELVGGCLKKCGTDAASRVRWTEGILDVGGMDFPHLMRSLEMAFGVKIVIEREDMPELKYSAGELRVSEGIDYALKTLRNVADFEYTKDYRNGTVVIR